MQHINVSEKLKILMAKYNMSLSEFAKFTGISRTSLSGYINDKVSPTIDPIVQICEKCGVSMDWLCSNPNTHRFVTGTDIIDFLLEFEKLHNFNFEINAEVKHDIADKYSYKFTLAFEESRQCKDSFDQTFNKSDLTEFLKEYSDLVNKLNSLNDADIKKNYFDMWLDKQREKYSHYNVIYKDDHSIQLSEELLEQFRTGDE